MLLYPQVYSTVNQNQIHLHLHGAATDKLEQYLNPEGVMISSLQRSSTTATSGGSVEVGISTESPVGQLGLITESETGDGNEGQENREDPNNVWRPY